MPGRKASKASLAPAPVRYQIKSDKTRKGRRAGANNRIQELREQAKQNTVAAVSPSLVHPPKRQRVSTQTSSEEALGIPRVPQKLCFFGRGGTPTSCSLLPVALRGGRLSDAALAEARRIWLHLPEHGFRMTDRVPPRRTNGGEWKRIAPPAARSWLEDLRSKNEIFWDALATTATATYDSNRGERPTWDGAVSDCVFAYGGLKRSTTTKGLVSVGDAAFRVYLS